MNYDVTYFSNNYDDEELTKYINSIKLAEQRYESQQRKVEDEKNIERLLLNDYLRTIRSNNNIWKYRLSAVEDACKYLGATDKKEKKKYKHSYDYVKSCLVKDFINDSIIEEDVELTNIIHYGFNWGYDLKFTVRANNTYSVFIPNMGALDNVNFEDMYKGKFALRSIDGCVMRLLISSYDERDIKNFKIG